MPIANRRVRDWAITSLTEEDAVILEIQNQGSSTWQRIPILQVTAHWAKNSIPTAQCLVAVGRHVVGSEAGEASEIGVLGASLRPRDKARILVTLKGETRPGGPPWPEKPMEIFNGYYLGSGQSQTDGKTGLILFLAHQAIDLTVSSCLSPYTHPRSPWMLSSAAVLANASVTGGNAGQAVTSLSHTRYFNSLTGVSNDLWGAIKNMLEEMASVQAAPPFELLRNCNSQAGTVAANNRLLAALKRIEGGSAKQATAYRFGAATKLASPMAESLGSQLQKYIGKVTVEEMAYSTVWDKLVGEILPSFRAAYIPRAGNDLVVADIPPYSKNVWRAIKPEDCTDIQGHYVQDRVLSAVGVYSQLTSQTMPNEGKVESLGVAVQGCYLNPAVSLDNGIVDFVPSPPWLDELWTARVNFRLGDNPGMEGKKANEPKDKPTLYTQDSQELKEIFNRYAKTVFYDSMAAGNSGLVAGRLRFDIAPGSIVTFAAEPDKFTLVDSFAIPRIGQVSAVTIAINAEAGLASTTFNLIAVRDTTQAQGPEGLVDEHPLFAASAIYGGGKHGAPLLDEFENLD